MVTIFAWAEIVIYPAHELYIGLAITNTGKWLAGAVSRVDEETAVARVAAMAIAKAKVLISDETMIVETTPDNPLVIEAMEKAFERMP